MREVPSSLDMGMVTKVLNNLHTRARKVHSSDILATLSQCSIYLSKAILHSAIEAPVLQVYRQSLSDFITRKNSALNTIFFQDFIRRYPTVAWNLRGDLVELSQNAINVYRQCQVFQLLHVLISHLPSVVVSFACWSSIHHLAQQVFRVIDGKKLQNLCPHCETPCLDLYPMHATTSSP